MINKLGKIVMMAGTLFALALTFSCSSDDNQGGNGGSGTNNLCNGVSYDQSLYRCELGELIGKCRGLDYYVAYEQCVDGVVVDNNSNKNSSSSSLATTSNTFTDTRDGKTYRIETFGSDTWMIENLRFGSGLYNQDGAKTACPSGWRLPYNNELSILQSNFGNVYIYNDSLWRAGGVWYVNNGKISTADCGKNYNDFGCTSVGIGSSSCEKTDPCYYQKYYNIRCVKDQSVATSSSSMKISSSSSKPSSSSVTYTLTCGNVPTSGTEGTAITAPTVTCNGTAVSSGLTWRNVPNWSNPVVGIYNGVSVSVNSGNCSGKTATCGGTLIVVVSCDMNYRTVEIGTQIWMAENLNCDVAGSRCYGEDGVVLPLPKHTLSDTEVQANCVKYGRLYDWSTAMALPSSCNSSSCKVGTKHQGICPSGWHIPSRDEWTTLINFVGSGANTKLMSTSGWLGSKGTDDYGFSALPGGYYGISSQDYYFNYIGEKGYWWSSSEDKDFYDSASGRCMDYYSEDTYYSFSRKSSFFSIRCLQN
ncbi:MAG: hypothetical protein LBC87_08020 [Fibromonadaceae bacterium]|jgi:uncharacterized protein (TIGR02145 family)|nr:hypothetical protein [Fibromonadaceae bacterium]